MLFLIVRIIDMLFLKHFPHNTPGNGFTRVRTPSNDYLFEVSLQERRPHQVRVPLQCQTWPSMQTP